MKQSIKPQTLRMQPGVYYVWCGGSCDYGHEERCSGGAYIIQRDGETVEQYVVSDDHTTEFRMILTVMIHAMEVVPEGAEVVFLTNVQYIAQNFDRVPTEKSANPDLIAKCVETKKRLSSVTVKLVPYHKYEMMGRTHELAHEAMMGRSELRKIRYEG